MPVSSLRHGISLVEAVRFPTVLSLVLAGMIGFAGTGLGGPAGEEVSKQMDGTPNRGPVPVSAGSDVSAEVTAPADPPVLKGPDRERDYFSRWHSPYDAVLDRDVLDSIWREVRAIPDHDGGRSTDPWAFLGPWGMDVAGTALYSGRLLDLDFNGSTLRFASASGGLWEFFYFFPIGLTETLTSQAIGTVATDPNNEDHIFVGTGEGRVRSGTGLFETTNRGGDWSEVTLPIAPTAFYRIRYVPGRPTHLLAATNSGILRSTNNGSSWTQETTGEMTDIAIWPYNPDYVWAGRWGDGVYKSTDAGDTWTKVTGTDLPTTNVGRIALTVHPGSSPILYASLARNDNNQMLGVYQSYDGVTWIDVSPSNNFLGSQGWYDNTIAVNPENSQEVLIGGVTCWRTGDGGMNWTQVSGLDMHADLHAILWLNDNDIWVGNDGGFCYSNDGGFTWATDINVLPTVQFYNIDVGMNEPNVMGGGTQDNGIPLTIDGSLWAQQIGQDGSGFTVDVTNPVQNIWATWGPRGGNWLFPPTRTTNRGVDWTVSATGIDPNGQWWTQITNDRVSPVYVYTFADKHVYQSFDAGATWSKLNTTPFPWPVNTFAVSRWQPGGSSVWAATASGSNHQLWVWDGSSWVDRSAGLPNGRRVRRVAMVAFDPNDAYVLMQGITSGHQIYHTTNLGASWINVTGDLPAVPVGDVVEHPTDSERLYLGTEMGFFRSTNSGVNWERWNYGMPEANIITDLATVDSLESVGRFYIVAGTYGRGLWRREVGNEDPSGVAQLQDVLTSVQLASPSPNPATGSTTVEFSLRAAAEVELDVYDIAGRHVAELARGPREAGLHRIPVDVSQWAAGVYFVDLQVARRSVARRFSVIR